MKMPVPRAWRTIKTKQRPEAHGNDEGPCLGALVLCFCLFLQCWAQYSAAAESGASALVATSVRDLNDKSARVRRDSAIALHNIGAEASSAVPKLISMLSAERDPDVREHVVRAIGTAGGQSPEAVPPLIQVLQHDRDDSVRGSAARSLGRMGMLADLSVPALVAALSDEAGGVRVEAAAALGAKAFAASAPAIVPALAAALTDKESDVRKSAGQALGKLGPNAIAALPVLRKLLVDSDSANRLLAAGIITQIGSQAAAAAPECLAALRDESIEVRIEAALALLSFGQHVAPAMELLVNALSFDGRSKDLRSAVRVRSAWAIGAYPQYATGAAIQKLVIATDDPDGDVRRFAAASLDKVLPALVKGHRVDAIASLKETKTMLQGSSVADQKMRSVAVANAITELEKDRGGGVAAVGLSPNTSGISAAQHGRNGAALGVGAMALACFSAAAVLRKRGAGSLARRRVVRVFISYRRQDSASSCGRIYDHLVAHFGAANVFRDIDSLAPGDRFAEKIREYISQCDAVIVLIGSRWLSVADVAGRRRLDDPEDFVRMEIMEAAAQGKFIVPALHDGAQMPSPKDLPPEVAFLAQRNAIELTDRHFGSDMKELVDALTKASGRSGDAERQAPLFGSTKLRSWWLSSAARQLPVTLLALGLLFTVGALWITYGHLYPSG